MKWEAQKNLRTAVVLVIFAALALSGFEVAFAGIALAAVLVYLE